MNAYSTSWWNLLLINRPREAERLSCLSSCSSSSSATTTTTTTTTTTKRICYCIGWFVSCFVCQQNYFKTLIHFMWYLERTRNNGLDFKMIRIRISMSLLHCEIVGLRLFSCVIARWRHSAILSNVLRLAWCLLLIGIGLHCLTLSAYQLHLISVYVILTSTFNITWATQGFSDMTAMVHPLANLPTQPFILTGSINE